MRGKPVALALGCVLALATTAGAGEVPALTITDFWYVAQGGGAYPGLPNPAFYARFEVDCSSVNIGACRAGETKFSLRRGGRNGAKVRVRSYAPPSVTLFGTREDPLAFKPTSPVCPRVLRKKTTKTFTLLASGEVEEWTREQDVTKPGTRRKVAASRSVRIVCPKRP